MERIPVNYMVNIWHDVIKTDTTEDAGFDDWIEAVKAVTETQGSAGDSNASSGGVLCGAQPAGLLPQVKSREEMTLEEYKNYIDKKISRMKTNSSRMRDTFSIYISEEGYAAMKADPAYEAWVLNTLQSDFHSYNFWGGMSGGRYVIHFFGATKEEHIGYSFSKSNGSNRRNEKSYWELRQERYKENQKKYYKELLEKRALMRSLQQKLFLEKGLSWAAACYEAKMIVGYPPRRPTST